MKQFEIPLKKIPRIIIACIVQHNIYIVNNEGIEGDQKAENKSARRIIEGEIGEDNELRGERARIAKMRKMIIAREDVPNVDEVNDAETNIYLLRENRNANDLLREATMMHKTLAENLQ